MPHTILFHSLRHLTLQSSPTVWVLAEGERLLAMGEGESWREELTADQLASTQVREAHGAGGPPSPCWGRTAPCRACFKREPV
ncbi:MAG TPA: hypothetical protein H9908_08975 [Candidatus Rothia avistercoris]|uniref:Uncharacterized protein n=1 Tax=Candidatus Rothia avistercoris TaxID=2840479 RepID=A0A9D2ZT68_9MICC|nr:hypothetical protein [Candidatus Rothia avistercoris]